MTDQEKEIATIRERNICLNLSDADVQRISEKAGRVNLSVSELLQNFIGDLVGGTYSNGSDERDLADQWFDRCWFGMFPDKTFLRYLIEYGCVDDALELWDWIKSEKEDLEHAATNQGDSDDEEIAGMKENIEYWQEQLNDIFSDFQNEAKNEVIGTLEEEMQKVIQWKEEVDRFKDAQ